MKKGFQKVVFDQFSIYYYVQCLFSSRVQFRKRLKPYGMITNRAKWTPIILSVIMEVDYLFQTLDKTLSSYLTQIIFAENMSGNYIVQNNQSTG